MQFPMKMQEFANTDPVGFQSLGREVMLGRIQPWITLESWNPATWALASVEPCNIETLPHDVATWSLEA